MCWPFKNIFGTKKILALNLFLLLNSTAKTINRVATAICPPREISGFCVLGDWPLPTRSL